MHHNPFPQHLQTSTPPKTATMPSKPQSLTTHPLNLDTQAFNSATQHPFLRLAGTSSLPSSNLLSWLVQDRLYALSYVSFIGSLISKTSLSSTSDRTQTLQWRVADLLIDALQNIRRELGLFEEVLREDLQCGKEIVG